MTFIIFIVVLLLISAVTPLLSPFFRGRKIAKTVLADTQEEAEAVPVSIIIVEHDSAFRLQEVLPHYLSQEYDADYQVVVVIDQNDSESEDVLKRHSDNPHLYYTMLPVTSRYLSRKKLGITLGMRAAKHDWVIVTDVHCEPTSNQWLKSFASHCAANKNMVLGMTPYEFFAPSYFRLEHLRTMLYHLREAQKGLAFSTNQSLVALRKSEFFDGKGFSGNLEYTRSEFEFLVNKFAKEDSCALALEPESWLTQYNPNRERWRMRHLCAVHSFPAMLRRGTFRFLFHLDLWAMHILHVLALLVILLGWYYIRDGIDFCPTREFEVNAGFVILVSGISMFIISLIVRYFTYRPVLKAFDSVSPMCAIAQEWLISWVNLSHRIRYWFADKNDFITHKL